MRLLLIVLIEFSGGFFLGGEGGAGHQLTTSSLSLLKPTLLGVSTGCKADPTPIQIFGPFLRTLLFYIPSRFR